MKNLSEIKDQAADFYDLTESQQEALLCNIRRYANGREPKQLANEVRDVFELRPFYGIGVVYEALAEDASKWSDFFYNEYERAFLAAESLSNAEGYELLGCLEETTLLDHGQFKRLEDLVDFLEKKLPHTNPVIRFKAVYYLDVWLEGMARSRQESPIRKIKNLLQDKNWRVRYIAHSMLEDLDALPDGFSLPFMDKLRSKVQSPFRF